MIQCFLWYYFILVEVGWYNDNAWCWHHKDELSVGESPYLVNLCFIFVAPVNLFFASGNLSFGANAKSNWSASAHVRYECQIRGYSGNTGAGDEWEDASELIVMIWVINRIFWELMIWIICPPESFHPGWRQLMTPTACLRCRIIL